MEEFTPEQKSQLEPYFNQYRSNFFKIYSHLLKVFDEAKDSLPNQLTLDDNLLSQENLISACRQAICGTIDLPLNQIAEEENFELDSDFKDFQISLPYRPILETESINLEKRIYSANLATFELFNHQRIELYEPIKLSFSSCYGIISSLALKYEFSKSVSEEENPEANIFLLQANFYEKLIRKIKEVAPHQFDRAIKTIGEQEFILEKLKQLIKTI